MKVVLVLLLFEVFTHGYRDQDEGSLKHDVLQAPPSTHHSSTLRAPLPEVQLHPDFLGRIGGKSSSFLSMPNFVSTGPSSILLKRRAHDSFSYLFIAEAERLRQRLIERRKFPFFPKVLGYYEETFILVTSWSC